MNKGLIKVALALNGVSLALLHSGLGNYARGNVMIILLFILAIIWLIAFVALIYNVVLHKNQVIISKVDYISLLFCTPLPIIGYIYILFLNT
jgi:hypothetical protein